MTGEDLQKLVAEVSDLSPDIAGKSADRLHHWSELDPQTAESPSQASRLRGRFDRV